MGALAWLGKNWIVLLAAGLTVAWAFIASAMLQASMPCPLIDGRSVSALSCRSSNEIGDLLAGLFSPVAFVWLVAAVIMQSSELRAQRQELELTRKEYELTRAEVEAQRLAMQEQVIETRKNVKFVEEQTSILRVSRIRDEQASIDARIAGLFTIALEQSEAALSTVIARPTIQIQDNNSRGMLPLVVTAGSTSNELAALVNYGKKLSSRLRWFIGATANTRVEIALNPEVFGGLLRTVTEIDGLLEGASDKLKDRMNYSEWWKLTQGLEELSAFLSTEDQSWRDGLAQWSAENP
ncbi:CCDC90 family protein [Devosia sp. SL43]|uniref:CCDC90 family protein n=1 Tax=Devosia sp. SL43 TaxID=2806348 RepID=UPI001F328DBA|nr:CCDC90 family protein [Devosia sp. SL43]UJW85754.1 hypothetical protein IM737_00145 [Devosia sp. SL43]